MKVSCPSCKTNYSIDDKRIPATGAKLKCSKCQATFPVRPNGTGTDPGAAFPSGQAPAASEPRKSGTVMFASGGAGATVPLPGAGPAPSPAPRSGTVMFASGGGAGRTSAVPLPGAAPGAAPPPGTMAFGGQRAPPAHGAVPLPAPPAPAATPRAGTAMFGNLPMPAVPGAVPLPGNPSANAAYPANGSAEPDPFAEFTDLPANPAVVPLPGNPPPASPDDGVDFADADLISSGPPPPTPNPAGAPAANPAPADDFSFDFDPPSNPPTLPPLAPPPKDSFEFDDLPSPAKPQAQDAPMDFTDAPTSRLDLSDLPSPAGPDFTNLPQPAKHDSESRGAAKPPDDFDLDFVGDGSQSAAPQAAAKSGEDLETLSFSDEKSSSHASVAGSFQIRRKSGKVFGPFEESVIVKMLEDGQLLGNEEVSPDGENWTPIGGIEQFSAAIQKLVESPPAVAARPGANTNQSESAAATMERLKQLYEGRMAAVSVVDRRSNGVTFDFRKRLPLLAGIAAVALVLGAGLSFGFTRYGVFGIHKIFQPKVSPGSPQFADFQKAKSSIIADTYRSYTDALEAAERILARKEFPEVRAVWCQAAFYLQRRYGASNQAQIKRAATALEEIQLLGMKNVEVVKAFAGSALAAAKPDEAIAVIETVSKRAGNDGDVELASLLAEAHGAKREYKQANDVLMKALDRKKDSAKLLHALGNLKQAEKNANEAAKYYAAALAADPNHAISAVELAAVELLVVKDAKKGMEALDQALDGKNRSRLGPAEQGRALALRGAALMELGKPRDAIDSLKEAAKLDPDSAFTKSYLARVLLLQHEYAPALPLYQEALARDSNSLENTDGYLTALMATGKMLDAKEALAKATTRFPGNGRIAYLSGRVEDALDNVVQAESNYKRAINADPKLFEADLYLARLHLRFKRIPQAKEQLESALGKAPQDAGVHAGLGELALAEGDMGKARAEFEKAVAADPTLSAAFLGRSQVLLESGEFAEAKKDIEKALELDPNIKGAHLQRGLVLWKVGDLVASIAELEKARTEDPRSARIGIIVGAVRLDKADQGDIQELARAETNLSAALSQEPTNPEAHFYLARVKSRRSEHTLAVESMKSALERAPKRPDYHYEMGLIMRNAGRLVEAIDEWKATLDLDPNHADALEALGRAYLDRGQYDLAIASYEKALKADKARVRIVAAIGDCYFEAGKWDKAIARYQDSLKADPANLSVYFLIGRAYTEKGQQTRAIDWYRKSIEADPANADAYYFAGYAYKERSRKKEALQAFQAYLLKRPDAQDKKEIEDEIYDLQH